MLRISIAALSLALLPLPGACAANATLPQGTPREAAQKSGRTKGAIFRSEIDRLIAAIAERTQKPGAAAPYSTSMLECAQILCAMGHCHRFYVADDNPRIRATIGALIQARRPDGSFGTDDASAPMLTAWTIDALTVLGADRYAEEIARAAAWLDGHGKPGSPWQHAVADVASHVTADVWPQQLGRDAADKVAAATPDQLDLAVASASLVRMVACQQQNRELDAAGAQSADAFSEVQQRAFAFLLQQQHDGVFDATFGGKTFPDPAFTGFGLLALQTKPRELRTAAENAVIAQGIQWLLHAQNADGSFGQQLQNYTTSVVVGALLRSGDPAAKDAMARAQKYILSCQNVEGQGYQSSDRDYGSIGYGGSQRGDLSNVHFALQALRDSGLPAGDEAFQKALVFLQRTQNIEGNDFSGKVSNPDDNGKLLDIAPGKDGGACYYPGNSAAGYIVTPDGKSTPRSYGSMTYALLKSYTLCGVDKNDPRVAQAVGWIAANWTLDINPGFDAPIGDKAHYAGLFYYYMVLAQSLDMVGIDEVTGSKDGKPVKFAWRKDLAHRLKTTQQQNGSWVNGKNPRWMEGVDVLCTCYAMLALERCHDK